MIMSQHTQLPKVTCQWGTTTAKALGAKYIQIYLEDPITVDQVQQLQQV